MSSLLSRLLTRVTLAAALGLPALSVQAGQGGYSFRFTPSHVIHVSCYRGPWRDVIWDRPNAVFIDSLVALGYDWPTAQAISQRICRDEALVFNPEGLKHEMLRIYHSSTAYRHRG
ncbi:hypothetical protein [Pseudooceanicola aestuarii]|uniref:hypothetical protein n=1 Tax=Pseudooceanicola aestuarii TaxID=2697319 RepID=UPI0013D8825A|nr:hypothetical protein [Pseudooceanicola aestuarii]